MNNIEFDGQAWQRIKIGYDYGYEHADIKLIRYVINPDEVKKPTFLGMIFGERINNNPIKNMFGKKLTLEEENAIYSRFQDVEAQVSKLKDSLERYKEEIKRREEYYEDCFACGARCLKRKMQSIAAFSKDVREAAYQEGHGSVLDDYTLRVGMWALQGRSFVDNETTAVFFCIRCKAELPKIKKNN